MSLVVLYKGGRGKGKTLTMVKDGLGYKLEGYKIMSNFHTSFSEFIDNEDMLELDKESELSNCVLMIDEANFVMDSRRSMTKSNIKISQFIQQIRKRNMTLLIATQISGSLDARLRANVDIVAFPNFIKDKNLCEVTYIDLTRMQDNDLLLGVNVEVKPMMSKIIFNAEPIFKLYNTSEMIV